MLDRNTQREAQVDLMKGICIFFVVLFHAGGFYIPVSVHNVIRTFYLPAFFFCSGLFFTTAGGFRRFMVKKTNMLVVPFVFFFLISLILISLFPPEYYYNVDWNSAAFYVDILYRPYSLATWFLWAILWTFLIYYVIVSISKSLIVQLVLVSCVWLLGCFFNDRYRFAESGLGWILFSTHLPASMMALPFMFAGHRLRMAGILGWRPVNWITCCLAIAGLGICFALSAPGDISYFTGSFGISHFSHLIAAFGGILFLWVVCMKLQRFPVLSVMGEFSLIVLCVHFFGIHLSTGLGITGQTARLLFALAFSFAGIWLLPKYLPWVIGRKPLFRVPEITRDDKKSGETI